jgi:hypothetical protein
VSVAPEFGDIHRELAHDLRGVKTVQHAGVTGRAFRPPRDGAERGIPRVSRVVEQVDLVPMAVQQNKGVVGGLDAIPIGGSSKLIGAGA